MSLRYSKYLDSEIVIKYAKQYGFAIPLNLERFIMDFELHFQISQYLDCVVRGGMCVPFHIGAKRLSVDIDLMTNRSSDDIAKVMDKISNSFPQLLIKKISPSDPLPVKNLTSYNVEFKSCLGGTTGVKIDFISDMDVDVSRTTSKTIEIFSVPIDHDITILSRGALIGDKISTLALGSIGVPQNTGHVPKQIFDIAGLLNSTNKDILFESLENFDKLTTHKIQNYTRSPSPTKNDILNDINSSLTTLFTQDFTLTSVHNSTYGSFTSTLLGSAIGNYSKLDHIEDILLTRLFSKSFSENSLDNSNIASVIKIRLDEFHRLKNSKPQDVINERKNLMNSIPIISILNKKILKNIPLSHAFLVIEHDKLK